MDPGQTLRVFRDDKITVIPIGQKTRLATVPSSMRTHIIEQCGKPTV